MHPLDDPKLTLAYAREHLNELEAAVDAYHVAKNKPLAVDFDSERQCGVIRLKMPDMPPWWVALKIGDVLHNLRASLDHLAWRLARLTMSVPGTRVIFPIRNDGNVEAVMGRLKGVQSEAQQVIERLQPYNRGSGAELLWLLHRMGNTVKHHHINVVGINLDGSIKLPASTTSKFERVDDGEIVATVPLRSEEMKEDLKPRLSVEVTLGTEEPGNGRKISALAEIHDFIRDSVFPRFECFFPD